MRNLLLPVATATVLFVLGAFILNAQLWYSARADSLAGAWHAIGNIDSILKEADEATRTAMRIADKECGLEEQYQLATEATLQPHLRTIVVLREGTVWCSSLPGNRVLLVNVSALSDLPLLLAPASSTVNGLPVLLYQTNVAASRIVVTISDRHIQDALDVPLKGVSYRLRVGNEEIGRSGDSHPVDATRPASGSVSALEYPYRIEYDVPPMFSLHRLLSMGGGILVFLLFISAFAAWILGRYLNSSTLPEEALRQAIARGEIVPFYQPVVNGREGTLRGVEVLARWKHPVAGFIPPDSFIPLAEKSGLIGPLTRSLMAQVVSNMNAIACKLPEGFHIGINYSASHIASPTFIDECLRYKRHFQRQDLNLVIEVTEREPLDINDQLVRTLNVLHENGFAIALDDFGTGYSGLSYLHDLHIDYLKIDKSFVSRVNAHRDSTRILDSVIDLARTLSISIVAEGVETQAQLDYLNGRDITFLQGYYFFRPGPFTEFVKILLSRPKVKVKVE